MDSGFSVRPFRSGPRGGLALLALAAITLGAAAQPVPPDDLATQLKAARDLHLQGKLEEARSRYLDLIPQLRPKGPSKALGDVLNGMSLIGCSLGDYTQALEMAEEASQIRAALGNRVGQARSINNAGLALLYLGEYEESIRKYETALRLDEANEDVEGQVIRNSNIGNVYFFQGRYLEALRCYQKGLELTDRSAEQAWSEGQRKLLLANMASTYQKLGQDQRALDLYALLREGSRLSSREEAQIQSNLGALYRHLGDPVKALRCYRQALDLFQTERSLDGEIAALKNVGIAQALDLKDYDQALATFLSVLEMSSAASNRRQEVQARLYAAETQRRAGRMQEARSYFLRALSGAREVGIVEEEWKALYGLSRLAQASGATDEAKQNLGDAIEIIESERSRLRLSSLKSEFLADKRDVYDASIAIAAREALEAERGRRRGKDSQALGNLFQLLQRAGARSFQDRFSDSLEERRRRTNPRLAHELRELRSKIARLWTRQLALEGERRAQLRAQLADLENSFAAKERGLSREEPEGVQESLTLKTALEYVPEGTRVVMPWTGDGELAFLWFSDSDAGLVVRTVEPEFPDRLSACLADLSKEPGQRQGDSCAAVFRTMVPSLAQALEGDLEALMIIPSGVFSSFPFETLPWADGGPLVEDLAVSYLPSLSLLRRLGSRTAGGTARLPWGIGFAGFANPRPDGTAIDAEREWPPPLPFAEDEVRGIARLVPGRSRVFLGPRADKEECLRELAKGPPLLHLATHATADASDPHRSRILFSGSSDNAEPDYLYLGEVLSLDLAQTQLVTLAACDTATGAAGALDGAQDLGRAFLLAGAQASLAALWKVPDQSTAQFMTAFYAGIANGLGRAEALSRAKRRFIESGGVLSDPYYWAGYVLYGDPSPVDLPLPWTVVLLPAAAVALLAVLGWFWRRRVQPAAREA